MKCLVKLWLRPTRRKGLYVYYLRWTSIDGKEKYQSLGHSDKRKAEQQRREKQAQLTNGFVEPSKMRLSELLEDYLLRTRSQIEDSTAKAARYAMKDFIAALGNISAQTISYKHCEIFQNYCLEKRNLGPGTVNTHIKMLKRMYSLAIKRGQLDRNPFRGIRPLKVPKKLVRIFSREEFDKLLKAADSSIWKARILLGKTCGLRRGEVLNLTANDIDFPNGKVYVQPKAEAQYTWRWPVKDKDRRELPLIEEVAQLLKDIQNDLPSDQPYLLLSPRTYRHVLKLKSERRLNDRVRKCPVQNFGRMSKIIFTKAGIEDGTFHDLRSTCITEWMEMGMLLHEVKELAGHADIKTTMQYYVGLRESLIDRARAASSAALKGKTVTISVRAAKRGKYDGRQVA